jgi:biopolymer transport protein TolR
MAGQKKVTLKKGKEASRDINVTPLIDVVLVLLIIFMVITPIMIYEMAVNLPDKTETVQRDNLPKDQLLVAACEDGTIALNRTVLSLEEVRDTLRTRLRAKAKKTVFVDAHPDAAYERVVQLLDTARDAGADRLGMASLKTPEKFTACSPAPPPAPAAVEGAPPAP